MARTILLICGSLRAGSVNGAILDTAAIVAPENVITRRCDLMAHLPHFNPDDDREPLNPTVARLRDEIAQADAVLFCTPEYAGALPGAFKNLLDWAVGGVGMDSKPVGWINASSPAAPAGGEDAHASLRLVLKYLAARIVEDACVRVPVTRADVGANGLIQDAAIRNVLANTLVRLANTSASPA